MRIAGQAAMSLKSAIWTPLETSRTLAAKALQVYTQLRYQAAHWCTPTLHAGEVVLHRPACNINQASAFCVQSGRLA